MVRYVTLAGVIPIAHFLSQYRTGVDASKIKRLWLYASACESSVQTCNNLSRQGAHCHLYVSSSIPAPPPSVTFSIGNRMKIHLATSFLPCCSHSQKTIRLEFFTMTVPISLKAPRKVSYNVSIMMLLPRAMLLS